ncbi:MAG: hypothetical protein ACRDHZ_14110 [Ktedonobacteraceae bacterium]
MRPGLVIMILWAAWVLSWLAGDGVEHSPGKACRCLGGSGFLLWHTLVCRQQTLALGLRPLPATFEPGTT